MDGLPPLDVVLECIPAANRRRLDEKLEKRKSRVIIAKSIRNWKTLAQFLPNIQNDIDGIEYDNRNLELQQIALLDKWLERNGPWATYRKLAECLYEAGAIETLQVLCKELGGNSAAMNAPPPIPPPPNPPQSSTSTLRCSRPLPLPTKRDLVQLVRVTNPYNLGLNLNLDESYLNIVRKDHPTDHDAQRSDVFTLYLQQTEEPSWLQVVAALCTMGETRLARTIMEKFEIYEVMVTASSKPRPVQQELPALQQEAASSYQDTPQVRPPLGSHTLEPPGGDGVHSTAPPDTVGGLSMLPTGTQETNPSPLPTSPPEDTHSEKRPINDGVVQDDSPPTDTTLRHRLGAEMNPPRTVTPNGSGGTPQPHNKNWEMIIFVACVLIIILLLALLGYVRLF